MKKVVGDQLKDHGTYRDMIEDYEGGRRCWTLLRIQQLKIEVFGFIELNEFNIEKKRDYQC